MNVLIIDDHELFRVGMRMLLGQLMPGVAVVDVASTQQGMALIGAGSAFDLVLLDWLIPTEDGLTNLNALRSALPDARLVVVSEALTARVVALCTSQGADGVIHKDSSAEVLAQALSSAACAKLPLSLTPDLPDSRPVYTNRRTDMAPGRCAALTPRQKDVMDLLAFGLANKEIGRRLGISTETVKQHLSVAYRELGARSRSEALYALARIDAKTPK